VGEPSHKERPQRRRNSLIRLAEGSALLGEGSTARTQVRLARAAIAAEPRVRPRRLRRYRPDCRLPSAAASLRPRRRFFRATHNDGSHSDLGCQALAPRSAIKLGLPQRKSRLKRASRGSLHGPGAKGSPFPRRFLRKGTQHLSDRQSDIVIEGGTRRIGYRMLEKASASTDCLLGPPPHTSAGTEWGIPRGSRERRASQSDADPFRPRTRSDAMTLGPGCMAIRSRTRRAVGPGGSEAAVRARSFDPEVGERVSLAGVGATRLHRQALRRGSEGRGCWPCLPLRGGGLRASYRVFQGIDQKRAGVGRVGWISRRGRSHLGCAVYGVGKTLARIGRSSSARRDSGSSASAEAQLRKRLMG